MVELLNSSILSAIISAIVAVTIFFISQWILSRRSTVELRTKKLEELYLSLNELSNSHAVRFEIIRNISGGKRDILDDPEHTHKIYLLDINKKILMYVRLYFPELKDTHIELFHGNRLIIEKIYELLEEGKIEQEEFIQVFVNFGNYIKRMEEEIITNRNTLIKDNILPEKYKRYKESGDL